MSKITFKIEKDTRWNLGKNENEIKYFVWAGSSIIAMTKTEREAIIIYEKAKATYQPNSNEIIREETIGLPIAS
jgi:hypothetical protein